MLYLPHSAQGELFMRHVQFAETAKRGQSYVYLVDSKAIENPRLLVGKLKAHGFPRDPPRYVPPDSPAATISAIHSSTGTSWRGSWEDRTFPKILCRCTQSGKGALARSTRPGE